jgi:serine protease Do
VDAEVDRETHIRLASSVLKIEVLNRGGGYSLGSGVLIDRDEVVTSCHVTRNAQRIHVLQGGLRLAATGQSAQMRRDLCVLRVPGVLGQVVSLAPAGSLKAGDAVIAVGYTGGLAPYASAGQVIAKHRYSEGQVIHSSTSFNSGASGGGLFDTQGRLLGVLTFRMRGAEGHYFSVPADWIAPTLHARSAFRPVAPLEGLAFWETSETRDGGQAADAAQPPFLQAAALKAQQQWHSLAGLSRRWAADDPQDSDAYGHLADALEHLGDLEGAEGALTRRALLEPDEPRGWLQLGRLRARMGRLADAGQALQRLRRLAAATSPLASPLVNEWADDLARLLDQR